MNSKNNKVYWCKCSGCENNEIAKKIRKGSIPHNTGETCISCGGYIIEEDAKEESEADLK
ncbi:MAG: hypothetical protein Q7R98_01415 [Candidatus Jorgensenbacteria bacterium]|nr:hypothetical protein [Candidatus Jorgensenbacteria bacterium]